MRQASIKIKSYAGSMSIVDNNDLRQRMLHLLLSTLGGLALFYVFILGMMVFNIVERKSIDTQARTLSNEVGELEIQYLSLSSKVDLNLGYAMGFKEAKAKYATRKSLGSIKLANNDL